LKSESVTLIGSVIEFITPTFFQLDPVCELAFKLHAYSS
jgi:hypothetical protein